MDSNFIYFSLGYSLALIYVIIGLSLSHWYKKRKIVANFQKECPPPQPPKKSSKFIGLFTKVEPIYYDHEGRQINFGEIPIPNPQGAQPPIKPYNFSTDTTATIANSEIQNTSNIKKDKPSVSTVKEPTTDTTIIGYCMSCKDKRPMLRPTIENMQTTNGVKRIAKGKCSTCGTNMGAILKKEV